ncbi:MAG: UDP-N-acetylmuramate--L-alanine ligase [Cyclobacteriaceae bacterium]|nr:UDP-N-acetylmuramate--L-alanine ligase [Cyclobacteriaceae bacterium]
MKKLNYDIVYFIGVGGIGMSALARWFNATDYRVFGYDKTSSELTVILEKEGIMIHYHDDVKNILSAATKENTLVIYTPAIPADHKELAYFKTGGFTIKKRAEVLGDISRNYFTVAVAGTHGKTTTSSMIAHLLHFAGVDITGFIGGIATNFNSNLVIGKTDKAIAVIEADEFDRSFLHLSPNIAVVTSTDADHLDIYGNGEELKNSFKAFINKLEEDGELLISQKANDSLALNFGSEYGLNGSGIRAKNIKIGESVFVFDYVDENTKIEGVELSLPGFHNVENALAAIRTALLLHIPEQKIKEGVAAYRGVKRRFEFIFKSSSKVYIDDYAHHPEELSAFIRSAKALYPGKKLTVIFQPHLFSRTKDFSSGFAKALDQADQVWLLDIYPARELPMEGVNSDLILSQMQLGNKKLMRKDAVIQEIKSSDFEVLATLGAGDIDRLVPEIKNILAHA